MSDDTIKKNISKNIGKYREKAGLSQKELANKLGIVPSRISNWETGANCPTIDILFEVCEVLNVSINDIYGVYPDSKFILKYGEQDLLNKYRLLDAHGREMVDFTLQKEWERSVEYSQHNIIPLMDNKKTNAAHEKKNISDEAKQTEEQQIQEQMQKEIAKRNAMMSDTES